MALLIFHAAALGLHFRSPTPRMLAGGSVCSADTWPALQAELDVLPVFVLANAAGEPLQQVDSAGAPTLAVFADLFRAEAELANANRLYPELGLCLLPVGLGDAFARVQNGTATLIPSQNELQMAQLDPVKDAAVVPLFGCTKMFRPRASDPEQQAMPLFMSSADARAALDDALSGFAVPDGMTMETIGMDILCIPLEKAVELIVSGKETRFDFVAPSNSAAWVKSYAEKAAEAVQDGAGDGAEPESDDGAVTEAEKQAMFEQLISQRQDVLGRTGGVFPGE